MIRMMSGGDEQEKLKQEPREFSDDNAVPGLVEEARDEKELDDRLTPLIPDVMKRSAEIEDDDE